MFDLLNNRRIKRATNDNLNDSSTHDYPDSEDNLSVEDEDSGPSELDISDTIHVKYSSLLNSALAQVGVPKVDDDANPISSDKLREWFPEDVLDYVERIVNEESEFASLPETEAKQRAFDEITAFKAAMREVFKQYPEEIQDGLDEYIWQCKERMIQEKYADFNFDFEKFKPPRHD